MKKVRLQELFIQLSRAKEAAKAKTKVTILFSFCFDEKNQHKPSFDDGLFHRWESLYFVVT